MKRRSFLSALGAAGAISLPGKAQTPPAQAPAPQASVPPVPPATTLPGSSPLRPVRYPRTFAGRQLSCIAFPLGGIGTGSISLGGRGQLQDWEIFNRPDKGLAPDYGFAAIYAQAGQAKPVTRVLEARLMPPYTTAGGLGPANAPGLSRLRGARFTGEFPTARIDFEDPKLPVEVKLEAFSPFIPLDPDNSGYPVAVLRYQVRNRRNVRATVSIAFTVENPVGMQRLDPTREMTDDRRQNDYRNADGLAGFLMTNRALPAEHPHQGSFALSLLTSQGGEVTYLSGWPNAKWWASPQLFWDDFSSDGKLGPEPSDRKPIASLCLTREIDAG